MNYLSKKDFEKSNKKVKIPKSKIKKRTIKFYQKLYNEKNKDYTVNDIFKFLNMLCDDLGIPNVSVKLGYLPLKKGNRKTLGQYVIQKKEIIIRNQKERGKGWKTFKTISNTVLHEFIHHYDLHYLKLKASPHCSGFFKRIINLSNILLEKE